MKAFRVFSLLSIFFPSILLADIEGMQTILRKWDMENKEWNAAYEFASPEGRQDLLKAKPNEVKIARNLWSVLGNKMISPGALPAVIWFLDRPAVIAESFDPAVQKKIANTLIEALLGDSVMIKGVGRAAAALSNSKNPQCRYILEQIRAKNPNSIDQGLAAMGLALMMRENTGMRRDDPRINAVRLKYIREAIIKAFDEPFFDGKVSDFATEILYEINNLHVRRKAPAFNLPREDGTRANVPNLGKHTLLVFWSPNIPLSHSFVSMIQGVTSKYPDLSLVSVCPALKSREGLEVETLFDTPKGEIFRLYRVNEAPWICLIDKEGVIRMRGAPDAMFSTLFEQLMQTINKPLKSAKKGQGEIVKNPKEKASRPTEVIIPPALPRKDGGDIVPPPLKPIPID